MAPRPLVDGAILSLAHLPFLIRQQDFPTGACSKLPELAEARTESSAR
jgi:hypothetical protein